MKISLCMIVLNEAANLDRCLASVQAVVDQIVVVDTGSTDDTRSVALRFGAEIYDHAWTDDFAAARNAALAHATGNWVLVLDADEMLSGDSASRLADSIVLAGRGGHETVAIRMHDVDASGRIHNAYLQNKMWRRSPDVCYAGRIHEYASVRLPALNTGLTASHFGYFAVGPDVTTRKFQRNYAILKASLEVHPREPRLLIHMAKELGRHGRLDDSLAYIEQAEAVMLEDGVVELPAGLLFQKCVIVCQGNDDDGALAAITHAQALFPDHFQFYFLEAAVHQRRGDWRRVITALERYAQLLQAYHDGNILHNEREVHTLGKAGEAYLALARAHLEVGSNVAGSEWMKAAYVAGNADGVAALLSRMIPLMPLDDLLPLLREICDIRMTDAVAEIVAAVVPSLSERHIDFLRYAHALLIRPRSA